MRTPMFVGVAVLLGVLSVGACDRTTTIPADESVQDFPDIELDLDFDKTKTATVRVPAPRPPKVTTAAPTLPKYTPPTATPKRTR